MRAHRLALVSAASALMFALGMPAGAATSTWPDVSGIYWTNSYSAKIQPTGGGDLPYTPAARADYAKNMAAVKTYALDDKARKLCTPDGVPRIPEMSPRAASLRKALTMSASQSTARSRGLVGFSVASL